MELITQFSVFLVNKPGVLAQVARQLAVAKINVIAMTMADTSEHGVLRLVAEDPSKVRQTLKSLNLHTTETEVLVIEMPNRAGALADICSLLANSHINIAYAYCTTGARGGKTKGVFKVADPQKAIKVLKPRKHLARETSKKLRGPVRAK